MVDFARRQIKKMPDPPPAVLPEDLKAKYGVDELVFMNLNENPYGPSPKAIEAVRAAAEQFNRYAEPSCLKLRRKIAQPLEIDPDQIVVGNGCDALITYFSKAYINEGDNVVVADPSFGCYDASVVPQGGVMKKVKVDEKMRYSLPDILKAIDEKTKMVIICNPNNPTATAVHKQEVADFMDKVPAHCIVLFDEAYRDFANPESYPDTLPYVKEGRNVLIMRTFSKFHGLAGQRIGYLIGTPQLVKIFKKIIETFPVNILAQKAAEAAVDDVEYAAFVRKRTLEDRNYLISELKKLGVDSTESEGNFLFVNYHRDADEVCRELLKRGFVTRPGSLWGFPEWSRISLATTEQLQKFVAALKDILK
jgi:histidinol-phosphate aminotransferase